MVIWNESKRMMEKMVDVPPTLLHSSLIVLVACWPLVVMMVVWKFGIT